MFFDLRFTNDDELYGVSNNEILNILEWQEIELDPKDKDSLLRLENLDASILNPEDLEALQKEMIEILSKYCTITLNEEITGNGT